MQHINIATIDYFVIRIQVGFIASPSIPRKALKYLFHSRFITFLCGVRYGKVRAF
jgi:hypothetical protein